MSKEKVTDIKLDEIKEGTWLPGTLVIVSKDRYRKKLGLIRRTLEVVVPRYVNPNEVSLMLPAKNSTIETHYVVYLGNGKELVIPKQFLEIIESDLLLNLNEPKEAKA